MGRATKETSKKERDIMGLMLTKNLKLENKDSPMKGMQHQQERWNTQSETSKSLINLILKRSKRIEMYKTNWLYLNWYQALAQVAPIQDLILVSTIH